MPLNEPTKEAFDWIPRARRMRGGRHFIDLLARANDSRRRSWLVKSLRRSGVLSGPLIPAYWWDGRPNFGDQLSPAIIRAVTGFQPILVSSHYPGKLLGVGSVLGHTKPSDTVWGSGLLHDRPFALPSGVEVLAVRGPLSRQLIAGDVPEVYGDPALLLPDFFTPEQLGRYPLGVVPHLSERDVIDGIRDEAILRIDVSNPWQQVVAEIVSCELVLSSSLHGLIVADAYGIPCAWIKIRDGIRGGEFKFLDYLASTGRDSVRPVLWDHHGRP